MANGEGLKIGKLAVSGLERLGNTAILVIVLFAVGAQWWAEEKTNRQLFESIDGHLADQLTVHREYVTEKRNLIQQLSMNQKLDSQWMEQLREINIDLRARVRDLERTVERLEK